MHDIIDLTGYLGYGNPIYLGVDITLKWRAEAEEIQQRKQHAADQLFKSGSVTELISPPEERAKSLYCSWCAQNTSNGHWFITLSPVPG